jgi:hypothetical protein
VATEQDKQTLLYLMKYALGVVSKKTLMENEIEGLDIF